MGFRLDPTQIRKLTPKTISLQDIQGTKMSDALKKRAHLALQSSDYNAKTAGEIVEGKKINATTMKQVIDILNKAKVGNLKNASGKVIVNQYIKKEIVKRTNLAQIRLERSLEARKERVENMQSGLIGKNINNKSISVGRTHKPRLGF